MALPASYPFTFTIDRNYSPKIEAARQALLYETCNVFQCHPSLEEGEPFRVQLIIES
jgi:hypothetical protein